MSTITDSSPSSSTSVVLINRVQSFVSDNRKAVIAGVVVVAAAAGGVYYYTTTARSPGTGEDSEKGKKKKSSSSKKRKEKDDGPVLEERKQRTPKPTGLASEDLTSDEAASTPAKLTKAEIEALPDSERLERANTLKTKGNAAYQARKFPQAVELYTDAIEISPKPEAVYYSNRAACYLNFSPPEYELVVRDCDEALKRDPSYIKALNRRANAFEYLDRLEESLQDFTTSTIFERFQNETSSNALERVLKKIASKEAKSVMASRHMKIPSYTFIYSYQCAFRPRPLPVLPKEPSQGDRTLLLACEALHANNYIHGYTLVHEAIEQGISWDEGKAEALNLRGTHKFLCGDSAGARDDLQASIDILPTFIQSWVKIASVHMDMMEPQAAFSAFESAIATNAQDPDTYYHRGQVNFIMGQYKEAEVDYLKSVALDSSFVFGHIQLAVAQYKLQQVSQAMITFRQTLKQFPQISEPQNYYGELLLDQQRFPDAIEKFDRAIEIERKRTPMNVVPLVNKALAIFQWQQDLVKAEALLTEALEIDPECDSAIATLAQLTLQQGNLSEAISLFSRHADIARTENELEQALTFKYATMAQQKFLTQFPEMGPELGAMARQMQQS